MTNHTVVVLLTIFKTKQLMDYVKKCTLKYTAQTHTYSDHGSGRSSKKLTTVWR